MTCTGRWVGELRADDAKRHPLVLSLEQVGSVIRGTAGADLDHLGHARADGTHDEATGRLRLRLETVEDATEQIQLDGTVVRDAIIGRFIYADRATGDVRLERLVEAT